MDNLIATGMIPMFLSGLTHGTETDNGSRFTPGAAVPRRLMLACCGTSPELAGVAESMASGFGRKEAGTSIYRIPDNNARQDSVDLAAYDGIFIGIAPDGSGVTNRTFAFIRRHINALSAMPVALFFLLSRAPEPGRERHSGEHFFEGLAPMSPLDVRIFQRSEQNLAPAVVEWARNDIWPLMETGWLADLIFPGPDTAVPEPVLSHG
ncbi:MAG: flavodoxin domain-containing protein [Desulfobacterales bacterium]|nr:flavodoxin domain-containing protein [Desulfobacterales bacterium]